MNMIKNFQKVEHFFTPLLKILNKKYLSASQKGY